MPDLVERIAQHGDVALMRATRPFKAKEQADLKRLLVDFWGKSSPKVMAMGLSKVSFIDSSNLGILIWGMKNLRQRGGDLVLAGLSSYVADVF